MTYSGKTIKDKIGVENREVGRRTPLPPPSNPYTAQEATAYKGDCKCEGGREKEKRTGPPHRGGGPPPFNREKKKKRKERKRPKGEATTKRTKFQHSFFLTNLLQFLQSRCINSGFLKIDDTGLDNFLDNTLVNFTLFFLLTSPSPRVRPWIIGASLEKKKKREERKSGQGHMKVVE